jgi:hypothetical protein
MKTERRHELQHNALADALGTAVEGVKPYNQIILGCILAVVVVIGVGRYLSIQSQAGSVDSWNSYLRATASDNLSDLSDVVERHPGTPAAFWSNLFIGDRSLDRGLEQLFVNKANAKDELKKAEEAYAAVLEKAREPLLLQRATLGLGRVNESNGELDKARKQYESFGKKWPDSIYASLAKQRLDDLDEKPIREFYDWFAEYQPRSQTPEGPGTPGVQPPFSLDNIPEQQPDLGPGTSFQLPLDGPAVVKPAATDETKPVVPADGATGDKGAAADKGAASEKGTAEKSPSEKPTPGEPAPKQPAPKQPDGNETP